MSHPELSSGGGSSLSSGKLSKLLVSVGDATCRKKSDKEGTVIRVDLCRISSPSHNHDHSKALVANCSKQEKFCIQQLFAESQPSYSNDPDPLGSLVQEQLPYPLVQGWQTSPGPPQRICNLQLQDPEFEAISWAPATFEFPDKYCSA